MLGVVRSALVTVTLILVVGSLPASHLLRHPRGRKSVRSRADFLRRSA